MLYSQVARTLRSRFLALLAPVAILLSFTALTPHAVAQATPPGDAAKAALQGAANT